MLDWIKNHKKGLIRGMFLVPIILVMIISISHVVSWYGLSNPMSWAVYLSIAIEIAAMSSIAAASVRVRGGVWFVFIIVTLIQFIGNIFFCYKETDITSQGFKDWVELTGPVFEAIGSDIKDLVAQRRWLALLEGGLLPLISLASLHFFIRYGGMDDESKNPKINPTLPEPQGVSPTEPTVIPEGPVTVTNLDTPTPSEDAYVIEQPVDDVKSEEVKVEEPIVVETPPTPNTEDIFPTNRDEVLSKHFHNKINGIDRWS